MQRKLLLEWPPCPQRNWQAVRSGNDEEGSSNDEEVEVELPVPTFGEAV
jgi:hypothetical protein